MDFGDLSDNPFAVDVTAAPPRKHKAVTSALKLLLLVGVCLTVVLVVGNQSKRWLVHQLTDEFDSLSSTEKQVRLVQIADLGHLGIEPLVSAMADKDIEVARAAYELLRRAQNGWTILDRDENESRHAAMVAALEAVAVQLPDDRTGWGTSLLQQTLMTTLDRSEDSSVRLRQDATHAMELLSLSDRAGPSILNDEPLDPMQPRRLIVQSKPLPVSAIDQVERLTDWPPPQATAESTGRVMLSEPKVDEGQRVDQSQLADENQSRESSTENPSVYRSSARLQPLQSNDQVMLQDVNRPRETAYQTASDMADDIRPATHIVDSPMETFDDKSVMHWLGSPHQVLREKAKLELTSRGFDSTELAIATQIASADTRTRIELIDAISRSGSMDPRPWLLMMLDDESRDVKLRVISILATMNDPSISQRLRMRMVDERDPTVAARIRRVLDLR